MCSIENNAPFARFESGSVRTVGTIGAVCTGMVTTRALLTCSGGCTALMVQAACCDQPKAWQHVELDRNRIVVKASFYLCLIGPSTLQKIRHSKKSEEGGHLPARGKQPIARHINQIPPGNGFKNSCPRRI